MTKLVSLLQTTDITQEMPASHVDKKRQRVCEDENTATEGIKQWRCNTFLC